MQSEPDDFYAFGKIIYEMVMDELRSLDMSRRSEFVDVPINQHGKTLLKELLGRSSDSHTLARNKWLNVHNIEIQRVYAL